MCSSVDITDYETRKYRSKPSKVKLRKWPIVRTIEGEIINQLFASHISIPLVNPQYMGWQVVLLCLLDHFFSHHPFPVCSTAVRLRGHEERISELTITTMQEISLNPQEGGECLVVHTKEFRPSCLCWSYMNKRAYSPANFAE